MIDKTFSLAELGDARYQESAALVNAVLARVVSLSEIGLYPDTQSDPMPKSQRPGMLCDMTRFGGTAFPMVIIRRPPGVAIKRG